MQSSPVIIGGRAVGPGHPPYVIAEMSGNHNNDLGRALAILDAAKAAGADAVKLQTYTADTLTIDHDGPDFQIHGGLWDGQTLYRLYQEAATPWDWHAALFARGREIGLDVFSTPFDGSAVDFLETLDPPAHKVASFEMADLPLVERVAATGRPLIVSTGLASFEEIGETVVAVRRAGKGGLVLLHCVSGYPTPPAEANLRTMPHLAETFGVPVGLSDHTMGVAVSVAAVALGACVIEKHFTLRRADGGPDAAFSLEPSEFKALVEGCRAAWESLGEVKHGRTASEQANATFRRSLYVVRDMAAGEAFTPDNLRSIRPGFGLAPKHLPSVLGKHAACPLKRGTALAWDMVADKEETA